MGAATCDVEKASVWRWRVMGLVLLTLCLPGLSHGAIMLEEIDTDVFAIYLNNIKIFQHNATHPMMFIGEGETKFAESRGNFHISDRLNSRIPLPYAIVYSEQDPVDVELYMDYYHYVRFEVHEDEEHALCLEVTMMEGFVDRLWLRLVAEPEEGIYGGGEQFSFFNLRGRSFPMWVREQGVGRNKSTLTTFLADQDGGSGGDYHTTYFPQPTFFSTRGYYLHHEGFDYTVLDFTHPEFHEVYIMAERNVSTGGRILIQNGSDPQSLVRHLSGFLGRQPELPGWVHSGAILGIQGGSAKLLDKVKQAEDGGVALAGVWIQDWVGTITTSFGQRVFWNWQWNQTRYPNLPSMISELGEKGIHVLGYINPYLHKDGSLFSVAEDHGYLVRNSSNQTFLSDFGEFFCGTIDLTNPAAFQWYKNDVIRRNMIDLGLSGWMADFGEYLPVEEKLIFHGGQSPHVLHNQWPVLWARLNREAVEEAGKLGEVVFWMRSGYSGVSNYSLLNWAGEQNVDWSLSDGLPSTLPAALSLAMSGIALSHFDIGGYTTLASYTPPLVRSEELLLRSAEMAVFTPVFRTHEGNQPWANVQYDSSPSTLQKFARLSRMFAAMTNYTHHVVRTSSETTGLAAQRPLFLQYPSDLPSHDVAYQYLYGSDLLVAPVLRPGVGSWDVYLPYDPETPWVFLWDESVIVMGGRTVNVPAPVGHPPVFYRRVSPFVSDFQKVAAEPLVEAPPYVPDTITVKPVPGGGGSGGSGDGGGGAPRGGAESSFSKLAAGFLLALCFALGKYFAM